ncbi:hypothetical protein GCM10007301_06860 [Azorhizobium oxalatiphilum]|uniref:Amino acid adenylation domain-containing protein n=2 Tax=Azorhizobium oxalatiphilum TaxID=980631 RepID=A0A917BN25_9HYPH|nr:hypothetical protein GCM10007301_06860 [Azorhizobium oxalatiphilum]
MQAAYWVGRQSTAPLGGVAAHLYVEFDGAALEEARLRHALDRLHDTHPMLRLSIQADGRQSVAAPGTHHPLLQVEDMTGWTPPDVDAALERKRRAGTHQKLALDRGQVAEFALSLLPGGRCRLHVDCDMIAVDPQSFRLLMEDLARFHEDAPDSVPPHGPPDATYFDCLDLRQADAAHEFRRARDKAWWRGRIPQVPDAPPLPWLAGAGAQQGARSTRLAATLSPDERQALLAAARRHRLTPSALMLGLFAMVLGAGTQASRFRVNVPLFHRTEHGAHAEPVIGEFSNLLILGMELPAQEPAAALCRRVREEMATLIAHSAYAGVDVMRDLSRHRGTLEGAPVVFTAGLDMSGGELFSERVTRVFGEMAWTVSQAPHVALDAQVVCAYGGLLINWDVRLDALPEAWVSRLFAAYTALARLVATDAQALDLPWESLLARAAPELVPAPSPEPAAAPDTPSETDTMSTPLNALQQAYLMGRGTHFPLGGVAMQEFREYRGRLDPQLLRARLGALVARHAGLRTRIHLDTLTQSTGAEPHLHLDEIDLSMLSPADAGRRIDAMREDYAHQIHDLESAPWHVLLFHLPQTEASADAHVVFVRFDALILDGRAIAHLMVALFGPGTPAAPEPPTAPPTPKPPDATRRELDAAYWSGKLAHVEGPPRLPWRKPLEALKAGRYARESRTFPRSDLALLGALSAAEGLFRNTSLTALLLDVLSCFTEDGTLCVGLPVAQPTGHLSNGSTFIALTYSAGADSFADRARRLQTDTLEGLEHLAFSGIDISRHLVSHNAHAVPLPVVITNGLSWETLGTDAPMRLAGGLTQTPQVAVDVRLSADAKGNLRIDIDHARDAIDTAVVRQILDACERAMAALRTRKTLALDRADIIALDHYRLNGTEAEAVRSNYLARIAENLFTGPRTGTAFICGGEALSYAALGDDISRIMGGLSARGLKPGDVVAVALPRSPAHMMLTVSCALLGLVFVPIDAGAPADRQRFLLENCRPALVVSTGAVEGFAAATPDALRASAPHVDLPGLMAALPERAQSEQPGYYLYTSGTTGKPKCVVVSNRATSNVVGSTLAHWQVTARDVFMSVTPLHHDMSLFDVFGSLTAGAALVIPAATEEKDAIGWNALVERHGVTLWVSVPAILEMLLSCRRDDGLRSLRLVAQGGDYIKPTIINALREMNPALRLVSLGGPTETTIWSIWHDITPEDSDPIPYGRPLPATRYFVLDAAGHHCPPHVVGRIHTAGVATALGYLVDGALTQTDFVTVADEAGAPVRAFRTGDQGFYRPDGTLIFAARVNGYVKVRGVRVSLPDIETELSRHPALRQVLVVDVGAERQGEVSIGLLYVGDGTATSAALRAFARAHLPESHVPTRFLEVAALPLSANGKPDRAQARALLGADCPPAPAATAPAAAPPPAGPSARITAIYREVIGPSAGNGDGNDLLAMGLRPSHLKAIAGRLNADFGTALTPGHLVRCRSAAQVAELIPHGA